MLGNLNIVFTSLFSMECVLKIIAFGALVSVCLCGFVCGEKVLLYSIFVESVENQFILLSLHHCSHIDYY